MDNPKSQPPAQKKSGPKRQKQTAEARLGKRASASLAKAAPYAAQPVISAVMALVVEDKRALTESIGPSIAGGADLAVHRAARDAAQARLTPVYQELCRCITARRAGRMLLPKTKGAHVSDSARQLIAAMTPEVLTYNQPVLDALGVVLAAFDAAQALFAARDGAQLELEAQTRLRWERLRFSVKALRQVTPAGAILARRDAVTAKPGRRSHKGKGKSPSKPAEKPAPGPVSRR